VFLFRNYCVLYIEADGKISCVDYPPPCEPGCLVVFDLSFMISNFSL
jgi:hypothetical protein